MLYTVETLRINKDNQIIDSYIEHEGKDWEETKAHANTFMEDAWREQVEIGNNHYKTEVNINKIVREVDDYGYETGTETVESWLMGTIYKKHVVYNELEEQAIAKGVNVFDLSTLKGWDELEEFTKDSDIFERVAHEMNTDGHIYVVGEATEAQFYDDVKEVL